MTKPIDPKPAAPVSDELDEKDLERVAGGTDDAPIAEAHIKEGIITTRPVTQKGF